MANSPSIMVRVLGDLSNLNKSFGDAKNKAGETSRSVSSSIGSMLSVLNRAGTLGPLTEQLSVVNDAFGEMADHAHSVGSVLLGLGGAAVGVGTSLAILGSKDQAARQQLQAAIEATGRSWDDYSARVEEAIKHNEKFGDTADETQNALQILTQATGDPTKALDLLNTATDLAAAKHESLTDAATQLGKAYNGSTKLLKEFGVNVDNTKAATSAATAATKAADSANKAAAAAKQKLADLETVDAARKKLTTAQTVHLRDAQQKVTTTTDAARAAQQKANTAQSDARQATQKHGQALDELGGKLKGQASAAADTFSGHLKAITTQIEDQAAAFGNKYGPALQVAGQAWAVLGSIITGGEALLRKFKTSSDLAADASKTQTAAAETATASAETAIATQTAAAESGQLAFEGMTTAELESDAAAVPLIATVGLVTAAVVAVGVAAYEVYTHWSQIWDWMKQAAYDVATYITGTWDTLIADLEAIPGQVAQIASTMWDSIWTNFKKVLDQIANAQVKLPAGLGGGGINIGDIATGPFWKLIHGKIPFFANGGLVTETGLIYAHAGEQVIPAGQPGRTGPAVVISNAHFSSDVDVDLFMRRAAWAVQTTRI